MDQTSTTSFPVEVPTEVNLRFSKVTIPYEILFVGSCDPANLTNILGSQNLIRYRNYHEAAYYLQHLIGSGVEELPDIIIGDYIEDNTVEGSNFGRFLKGHSRLMTIPFVLMESKQTRAIESAYSPIVDIDDILRSDITREELFKKILLLKKFKALRQFHCQQQVPSVAKGSSDRRALYKIDGIFKRIIDILIASVAITILIPVLLIIAIVIKLDSKGPIFYMSYRAGSNYRIFKFIKFRTMIPEADSKLSKLNSRNQYIPNGKNMPVFFKISDDPRVTRVGKFLRNTSLDELPQLLNVLKGDMSLVGNRPLPLYEARTLTTDRHAERFNAPAGITGLWQISKRGQREMSVEDRIALDIDYARHNSFVQDLQIILKTPKALIQKENV